MHNACEGKKRETDLNFVLKCTAEDSINTYFARLDREKFGNIKNITDKEKYNYPFKIVEEDTEKLLKELQYISKIENMCNGGGLAQIDIEKIYKDTQILESIIKYSYDNIQYIEFK